MANKPAKRKVSGGRPTPTGGRTTPKGTTSRTKSAPHPEASSRYTPPVPKEFKVSPPWVPVLMFTLLAIGLVVIFCNYLGVLPGGTKNSYLLVGLGAILGGIVTATQYR
ncbi:MAG: cell division protein CrgA [Actinomycetota bacterium]|nr:cell division protein CrgA [Actinomycetota bacterium]